MNPRDFKKKVEADFYRFKTEKRFLTEVLKSPVLRLRYRDSEPSDIMAVGDSIAEKMRGYSKTGGVFYEAPIEAIISYMEHVLG